MYMVMLAGALISLVIVSTLNTNFVLAVGEQFKAKLKGSSEVPPVNTTATGTDRLKVNADFIRSIINISGITDVTMAHIHAGINGQNGEPVVDLLKSADQNKTDVGIIIKTRIHATDLQGPMAGKTLQDLQTAMGNGQTYVNIHTSEHPQGEIRGEIKERNVNATNAITMNATSTAEKE